MPKMAKGGPRDSVFSVRLPARLRYAVELIARLNHEPMTDVIVRALSDSLTSENGGLMIDLPGEDMPVFLLPRVWDERESVRLVKLALAYPALLSANERAVWEHVRNSANYWKVGTKRDAARKFEQLDVERLEADWETLRAEASSHA